MRFFFISDVKTFLVATLGIRRGFSFHSLCLLALAHATASRTLLGIARCTTVGVATSFYSSVLIESTAYTRMARRMGMTLTAFVVADTIVHIAPLVYVLFGCGDQPVLAAHGGLAAALNAAWFYAHEDEMDEMYVPMPRGAWRALIGVACASELAMAVVM